MLWDGRVSLCCADFDGRTVLGDLRTHSIRDVWNSEAYRKVGAITSTTAVPICQSCDLPKKDSPLWISKLYIIALLVSAPLALAQAPMPTAPPIAPPIQISAQTAKALIPIREQLRIARSQLAFDALEKLEPAPDVLRLRIQAAVGLEKFDAARSRGPTKFSRALRREETAALGSIASAVTRSLVRVQDPVLVTAACESILAQTPGDECRKTLEKQTTDSVSTPIARLGALAALARAGDKTALARYKAAAATEDAREQRAVIDTVKGLPAEVAVPALARGDGQLRRWHAVRRGRRARRLQRAVLEGRPSAVPGRQPESGGARRRPAVARPSRRPDDAGAVSRVVRRAAGRDAPHRGRDSPQSQGQSRRRRIHAGGAGRR